MIIYTDDIVFAQSMLYKSVNWKAIIPSQLPDAVRLPVDVIISKEHLFQGFIALDSEWKYLLIVKFAQTSQFETLCSLCRSDEINKSPLLCLAESGKNFKGFKNRSWMSEPGNLHLSVYLTPMQEVTHFHIGFTLICVNSVIQTLDSLNSIKNRSSIKWVNDILIEDRKVSGVLAQTYVQGKVVTDVVLGIGINIEKTPLIIPDIFVPKAGCLWDFSHHRDSKMKVIVLKKILENLFYNYRRLLRGDYEELLEYYINRSCILGRDVAIYSDPQQGDAKFKLQGKVKRIGKNLELYIEGIRDPVSAGRLAFTT
jgi:biotin-[acetyl-CoA-carboxylase] ligase BirA-like protein